MKIREARRSDGPAFLGLVQALADFEKLEGPSPAARRRLLRDAFGPKPRYRLWVVEVKSRVVAYAVFFFTYSSFLARPTLYLEDIFVHPDARGQGIASAVMKKLAKEARRQGCGRFEWMVLDWNENAIRLYRKLGGRHMKEWLLYRVDGEALPKLASRR